MDGCSTLEDMREGQEYPRACFLLNEIDKSLLIQLYLVLVLSHTLISLPYFWGLHGISNHLFQSLA